MAVITQTHGPAPFAMLLQVDLPPGAAHHCLLRAAACHGERDPVLRAAGEVDVWHLLGVVEVPLVQRDQQVAGTRTILEVGQEPLPTDEGG